MNIFIKTKSYLKRYGVLNLIRKVTEKASRGFDIIRMTGISGRHLIQLKTSHTKTGSYV